jgi:hypothetical protein
MADEAVIGACVGYEGCGMPLSSSCSLDLSDKLDW